MVEPQEISPSNGKGVAASNSKRISTYLSTFTSGDVNTPLKSAHDYQIAFNRFI